jgi:hypothetical protein
MCNISRCAGVAIGVAKAADQGPVQKTGETIKKTG